MGYAGEMSSTSLPHGRIPKIKGKGGSGTLYTSSDGLLWGTQGEGQGKDTASGHRHYLSLYQSSEKLSVTSNEELLLEAEISTQLFKSMTATCISLRVEGTEICFVANN